MRFLELWKEGFRVDPRKIGSCRRKGKRKEEGEKERHEKSADGSEMPMEVS